MTHAAGRERRCSSRAVRRERSLLSRLALTFALLAAVGALLRPAPARASSDLHLLDVRLSVAGRMPPPVDAEATDPEYAPEWRASTTLAAFLGAELGLGGAVGLSYLVGYGAASLLGSHGNGFTGLVVGALVAIPAVLVLPIAGVRIAAGAYGLVPNSELATFLNALGVAASVLVALNRDFGTGVAVFAFLPASLATLGAALLSHPKDALAPSRPPEPRPARSLPDEANSPDSPDDEYDDFDDEARLDPPPANPFRFRPPPVATIPVLALHF